MEDKDVNMYQQIGQIQGTVSGIEKNLSDFRSEFRSATSDQNRKIEHLGGKVEDLEQFQANYEGAKAAAARNARISGATMGGGSAIVIEVVRYLITLFTHK